MGCVNWPVLADGLMDGDGQVDQMDGSNGWFQRWVMVVENREFVKNFLQVKR